MAETASLRFMGINTNGVTGYLGTNIVPGSLGKKDSGSSLASLVENVEPTPNASGSFEVVAGTPCIIGGVGNWKSGEVSNASMWIQDPDGTMINANTDPTATDPNAQATLFLVPHSAGDGTIMAFVLLNPTPGMWKVGLNYDSASGTSPFELNVTAVPAGGLAQITLAYQGIYQVNHPGNSLVAKEADTSWSCICCTIGAFALALTVIAVGVALATLEAGSAIIISIATFFSTTPENVVAWMALVLVEAEGIEITVDFILGSMCQFFGACS